MQKLKEQEELHSVKLTQLKLNTLQKQEGVKAVLEAKS